MAAAAAGGAAGSAPPLGAGPAPGAPAADGPPTLSSELLKLARRWPSLRVEALDAATCFVSVDCAPTDPDYRTGPYPSRVSLEIVVTAADQSIDASSGGVSLAPAAGLVDVSPRVVLSGAPPPEVADGLSEELAEHLRSLG